MDGEWWTGSRGTWHPAQSSIQKTTSSRILVQTLDVLERVVPWSCGRPSCGRGRAEPMVALSLSVGMAAGPMRSACLSACRENGRPENSRFFCVKMSRAGGENKQRNTVRRFCPNEKRREGKVHSQKWKALCATENIKGKVPYKAPTTTASIRNAS